VRGAAQSERGRTEGEGLYRGRRAANGKEFKESRE